MVPAHIGALGDLVRDLVNQLPVVLTELTA